MYIAASVIAASVIADTHTYTHTEQLLVHVPRVNELQLALCSPDLNQVEYMYVPYDSIGSPYSV